MKKLSIKYKREIIGLIAGSIAGWLYWRFVGCSSGGCMITSSPIISSLYGGVMGFFVGGTFKKSNSSSSEITVQE